jgi:dihydroxyacetone kinase-like protein
MVARAVPKSADKVRLVTLAGSGYEPGLSGFVDYSAAGEIFAAPGAPRCIEAIRSACAGGSSALLIVLNHAGDVLSANIAMEAAQREGCKVKMVLTHKDIACGPNIEERRGIFELGDDEMEIGMGQFGEAGTGRGKLKTADETAEIMLDLLLDDLPVKAEDLLVILNGAATTLRELLILFRRVALILEARKIRLVRSAVGEFITHTRAGWLSAVDRPYEPRVNQAVGRPGKHSFFVKP